MSYAMEIMDHEINHLVRRKENSLKLISKYELHISDAQNNIRKMNESISLLKAAKEKLRV